MLEYDFEQSVGYWIGLTSHMMQRSLNEELAGHGITYRQWVVLACLALEGSLTQAQLADWMQIEPATLVSVLGRMERNGWIHREDCPTDRRKKLIRATDKVKPVWTQSVECARRIRSQATRGMTTRELDALKQSLAKMRRNLSDPAAAREAS